MGDLAKQEDEPRQNENADDVGVSSTTSDPSEKNDLHGAAGRKTKPNLKPKRADHHDPSVQQDLLDPNAIVEVTVADGRSIWDGKTHHKPGAVLVVSREEAASLRRKGFIHDPEAIPLPKGNGLSFTSNDGPQIKGA